MTTYLTQVTNAIREPKIGAYWLAYFRERFRGTINDQILESFEASGLTKADIARKLDRRPEQITRWLSAPCNLEADTISDIALALGLIPRVRFEKVGAENSNNRAHSFIESYDKFTSTDSTETRTMIVKQLNYSTNASNLLASTGKNQRDIFTMPATADANVREIAVNA